WDADNKADAKILYLSPRNFYAEKPFLWTRGGSVCWLGEGVVGVRKA
ncbi:hypothetical protein CEXT_297591, partial [Caerostris extrusa]